MKAALTFILVGLLSMNSAMAKSTDIEAIKETIQRFAKAGDEHDIKTLETCLDANYRVVMNQLFGSETVSVITRDVYLAKISSKEWGGDQRKVSISNLVVNGQTASAQVVFAGKKMTFTSLVTLVKDAKGNWRLISDVPIIS